jgi:hypothetical protein
MTRPDIRLPREVDHPWHVAINQYDAPHTTPEGGPFDPARDGKRFMYEAKRAAEETPRLALLFGMERRRELAQVHHQCSHDHQGEPVPDNHLTCCLGVACRACPHLAAIDTVQTRRDYSVRPSVEVPIAPEERDVMKAWTCVAHILSRGGDSAGEGYILTTDDRLFWTNLYASLAGGDPGDEPPEDETPEPPFVDPAQLSIIDEAQS